MCVYVMTVCIIMCMISSFLSPSVPLTSTSAGKSKWRVQPQVREAVSRDTCHSVHPARQSLFHTLLNIYTPGITMNRHNISNVLLVEHNISNVLLVEHNISIVGLSVIIIVYSMAWEGGNLIMSRDDTFLHLTQKTNFI